MPSYNLVNGRPAHLSPLINDELRTWTTDEVLVVSDAYAPANLFGLQQYLPTTAAAYAAALKAGRGQLHPGRRPTPTPTIERLTTALDRGLITPADIDTAVRRALAIRFRLGEFDPPELDPYRALEPELVNCPTHRPLARDAARQAIVLLKHECQVLPLAHRPRRRGRPTRGHPLGGLVRRDPPLPVTAPDGINERLSEVEYCEGVDRITLRIAGRRRTSASAPTRCSDQYRRRRVRSLRLGWRRVGAALGAQRPASDRHRRR